MRAQRIRVAIVAVVVLAGCQSPFLGTAFHRKEPSRLQNGQMARLGQGQGQGQGQGGMSSAGDPATGPVAFEQASNQTPQMGGQPTAMMSQSGNAGESVEELLSRGNTAVEQADRMEQVGRSSDAQKLYAYAKSYYHSVLQHMPNHSMAHHRLAVIADKQNDFQTAETHYLSAIQQDPTNANLLSDLGYSYLLQERLPESERYLHQALVYNASHPQAINNLGLLYAKQGDSARALAMFRRTGTEEQAQAKLAQLFPQGIPSPTLAMNQAGVRPQQLPTESSTASQSSSLAPLGSQPRVAGSAPHNKEFGPLSLLHPNRVRNTLEHSKVSNGSPGTAGAASPTTAELGGPSEQTRQLKALMNQAKQEGLAARQQERLQSSRATSGSTAMTAPWLPPDSRQLPPVRSADPARFSARGTPDSHLNNVFTQIDRGGRSPQSYESRPVQNGRGVPASQQGARPIDAMPPWPSRPTSSQAVDLPPLGGQVFERASQTQAEFSQSGVPNPMTASPYGVQQAFPAQVPSPQGGLPLGQAQHRHVLSDESARAAAYLGMQAGPGQLFPVWNDSTQRSATPPASGNPQYQPLPVGTMSRPVPSYPATSSTYPPTSATYPRTGPLTQNSPITASSSYPSPVRSPGDSGLRQPNRALGPPSVSGSGIAPASLQSQAMISSPTSAPSPNGTGDPLTQYETQLRQHDAEQATMQRTLGDQRQMSPTTLPQWPYGRNRTGNSQLPQSSPPSATSRLQ